MIIFEQLNKVYKSVTIKFAVFCDRDVFIHGNRKSADHALCLQHG